ncbi:hypothetical protein LTR56_001781 [Elasticomyces elasticus]|nr:hypothetical protein LTR56_001781 [Elasticomyces elasticus]KAK3668869.1 hypothetical protein LTR22_000349 [Elasticomyces elasticus]KAK4924985.1 hypothetical protein LTR49_007991 [Elasticomyces elasticus]KAK5763242.1 hypothetical protein LTS12_006626 [Elasticomyces elasticus]
MAQASPIHFHGGKQAINHHGDEVDTIERVTEMVHKIDGSVASEPAPHKATRCYLLEIPPELRLRIYGYVFDKDFQPGVFIWPSGEMLQDDLGCQPKNFSSVLKTCRLIAREATPVLYEGRTFYVHVMPDRSASEYRNGPYEYLRPVDCCLWFERVQTIKLYVYAGRTSIANATQIIKSIFARRHQKQTIAFLHLSLSELGEGDADPLYKVLTRLSFSSGARITHYMNSTRHVVSKEVLEEFQQASGPAEHVF